MVIIGGPASQLLAGRVAANLNETLALCDYRTFPDGESYSQIQSELDDDIVIIQSTPTDQDLVYLLQLLDICQGRAVKLVMPYFGYARQDKIFQPGEPMTARAVATALNPFLKEGSVHLVNIHAPSIMIHFHCQAENLDATPLLAERIGGMGLHDPVVISPDKGAMNMARTAAAALSCDCDFLQKTRLSGTEVSMAPQEVAVAMVPPVAIMSSNMTTSRPATATSWGAMETSVPDSRVFCRKSQSQDRAAAAVR
ncbi:MAG: ribose-phosphate diphosphokinase, partial [Methanothrix sp.]